MSDVVAGPPKPRQQVAASVAKPVDSPVSRPRQAALPRTAPEVAPRQTSAPRTPHRATALKQSAKTVGGVEVPDVPSAPKPRMRMQRGETHNSGVASVEATDARLPSQGETSGVHNETPKRPQTKLAKVWDIAQYPLFAGIAIAAAYSTGIGQWFVLAYAIIALIRRSPSQLTFGVALFLLIAIPIFQLLHQEGIASNAAVYVFELLAFGTLQASLELVFTKRKRRNIAPSTSSAQA